jgi:iron complex transport system substrate-binding protein
MGHRPLVAVGRGSYQGEILEAAGGINIIEESLGPWPVLNEEFVLHGNPEVILDSSMGKELKSSMEVLLESWSNLSSIDAVKMKRIEFIHHDALYRPGPRMVDALRLLADALHPGG